MCSIQEIKMVLEWLRWTTLFEQKVVEQLYLTLQKPTTTTTTKKYWSCKTIF